MTIILKRTNRPILNKWLNQSIWSYCNTLNVPSINSIMNRSVCAISWHYNDSCIVDRWRATHHHCRYCLECIWWTDSQIGSDRIWLRNGNCRVETRVKHKRHPTGTNRQGSLSRACTPLQSHLRSSWLAGYIGYIFEEKLTKQIHTWFRTTRISPRVERHLFERDEFHCGLDGLTGKAACDWQSQRYGLYHCIKW